MAAVMVGKLRSHVCLTKLIYICSTESMNSPKLISFFKFFDSEARVTVLSCQWLMGTCKINSVDLPDGTSCESGVTLIIGHSKFSLLCPTLEFSVKLMP